MKKYADDNHEKPQEEITFQSFFAISDFDHCEFFKSR